MQPEKSPRIGTWDAYQDMANPLVIEEDDAWRDLTLADLTKLIKEALRQEMRGV